MPHFASLLTSTLVALSMAGGAVAVGSGNGKGQASYYTPNGGQGACGGKGLQNNDLIVALPSKAYAGGKNCNKKINVTFNGKTVQGTVKDLCPGCPQNQIDLSEGYFKRFGSTDIGILKPLTWTVVG
ncbi:hypothetical protein NQ176_g8122 [Zarea fungicola]|uniref:Uncharacterized protein n=1 Tax=Zarea fungicola TaxID=93591 RepID=A0ACC1MWF6_9HYPO|nr:hypothetical protein NQ176_g8122 [Lecanicillium fungicola]